MTRAKKSRAPSKKSRSTQVQIVQFDQSPTQSLDMGSLTEHVWNLSRIQDYLTNTVREILSQRDVPQVSIEPPVMDITVPAIEAMRYSPLRREIAALIATTMDDRRRDDAHPAFLNILSQLTRDEIKLLNTLPEKERLLPVANLYVELTRNQTEVLYRNIVPKPLASVCEAKSRIPNYIDNLKRLQLIEEPKEFVRPEQSIYSEITRQPFCKRIVNERGLRQKTRIERRVICLSDFGSAFREVCIA